MKRVDLSRADALRVFTGINDYVAQHPEEFRKPRRKPARPGCGLFAVIVALAIVAVL